MTIQLRTIFLCILLVLFSFFPAPCLRARQKEPVRIILWNLPEQKLFYGIRAAVRDFEKRTGIRVETSSASNPGDQQKLMTALAAGTPPDLLWQDRFTISSWAHRNAFLPLDDLIARDGIRKEDYYRACWNEVVYEGKAYGLPWNTDARALFYNKDIFEREGIEAPPSNWKELQEYAVRLTTYHDRGFFERIGFAPNYGNAWLYLYGWLNGGSFLSNDGHTCTLNDPLIVEALEYVVETYDAIGGARRVTNFEISAQQDGIADPFLAGRVAMKIDGNWIIDHLVKFRPDFNFGVAPPPPPEGKTPVTWSGGFAWAIPRGANHPEAAWELAKWLNSREAWILAGEAQKEFNQTEGHAYYIPMLSAHREINKEMMNRFVPDLPNFQQAMQVFLDLMEVSEYRPVTPVGPYLWDEQARALDRAIRHDTGAAQALEEATIRVQRELDDIYRRPDYPLVNWKAIWSGIGILFAVALAAIAFSLARWNRRVTTTRAREAWTGILFCTPWMIGFLLLMLGPMLFSLVLVFCKYSVLEPAEFVGLEHLRTLFGFQTTPEGRMIPNDPFFWKSLWNTGFIVLLGVPGGMLVGLVMALLVHREIRGISVFRTIFYMPVVVPMIVVGFMFMQLLNPETGLVSVLLNRILLPLGLPGSPNWFGDPLWAKPGVLLMLLWTSGGTMVIWLAGLKSIPGHLYEAAAIDGAGRWQTFCTVTVPLLTPCIFFNLIMGTIAHFQVFTQAYVIAQPPLMGPGDSLMFLVIYLFRNAFAYLKMGYASGLAWVLFCIILILTPCADSRGKTLGTL